MAYNSNISSGTAPILWSNFDDALQRINENFTLLGAALARNTPAEIAHIETGTAESTPVRVVTVESNDFTSGAQATLTATGVSQLDNNTYFIKAVSDTEVELFTDEELTAPLDGTGFDVNPSGGGEIQTTTSFANLDFRNLYTGLWPAENDVYTLGDETQRWKSIYLSPFIPDSDSEDSGLWIGSAQIKGVDNTIELPANATVNGSLIIDPDKTFFKAVQIEDGNRVAADEFVDTLNLLGGDSIRLSVDSSAESITFDNTGVTALAASSGIDVSSSTGNITVTNTGVLTIENTNNLNGRTQGIGIAVDSASGNPTLTNTGVIEVQGGFGITVSTETATGIATIQNSAPAQPAFGRIRLIDDTFGINDIVADITTDQLTLEPGYGIQLTNNPVADALKIEISQNIDINGSVYADDSTILVNGVDGIIPAENLDGIGTIDILGNTTGYHLGDVTGSVFADDSTKLVDGANAVIPGTLTGNWSNPGNFFTVSGAGFTANSTTNSAFSINDFGLSFSFVDGGSSAFSVTDNLSFASDGDISVAVDSVGISASGNFGTAVAGLMTLSIVDDLIVNASNISIGNNGITADITGSVFADDSSMVIDGVNGQVVYTPATASDWNGNAPTTVGEAIDRLAALVKTLNGGIGA